jgi:hypothetical protein
VELKGPDGELVPRQDAVQMRLAMNNLLKRAGVAHDGQMGKRMMRIFRWLGLRFTRVGRGGMKMVMKNE